MKSRIHQLADLILNIEAEMRGIALWDSTPPSEEAMQSLVPFCHDTLYFHQWMQWVFLPKMRSAIETERDMPTTSDIYPLAEYSLQKVERNTQQLLQLIEQFDRLISRT
ncbi:MAG: YqcC family protein [Gammaproteobacteria bacterium]|nr:YqcC family protein [Gammaproteobacteria bacterium]